MSVDKATFNAFKALTEERLKAIASQIQILRSQQSSDIDAVGFEVFKTSVQEQLKAITEQLQVLRSLDQSSVDDVSFAAYKALLSEQISGINKQLQELRANTAVPADLRAEFADLLNEEMNAGKIKGRVVNISNLQNRSILVYNSITNQFECQIYRVPEHIEQRVVYMPLTSTGGDTPLSFTGTTTDATETELLINGTNRLYLELNTTMGFTFRVIGKENGGTGDSVCFRIEGAIQRDASGTTSLVGYVTVTTVARSNKVPWTVRVSANDTFNALVIKVQGEDDKTISWQALLNTVSVSL